MRDILALFPKIVARSPRLRRLSERLEIGEIARTDANAYFIAIARQSGAKIGENCRFYSWVVAREANLIEIGDGVIISGGVQFVTHDGAMITQAERFPGVVNHFGRIKIGDKCFIGLSSIILPGVELGEKCIVAAGSVVMDSFHANSVIAGNPARYVCPTTMYMELKRHAAGTVYDPEYEFPRVYPPEKLAALRDTFPLKTPRRQSSSTPVRVARRPSASSSTSGQQPSVPAVSNVPSLDGPEKSAAKSLESVSSNGSTD
ncbi:MAG TPA: acyltransferase [Gemmatimonadaceae bacterium]